jgi:hypothetical protein
MWALQAARMGIKWRVGNGRKVRFWEDIWFGNSSLETQFWPLYVINDQQGKTISQVWDGHILRLTFRRSVSENLMNMWYNMLSIVEDLNLQEDDDQIIWSFSSNGKFSVQSLYAVINHRGVVPLYVSSVWKLKIPPRVQIFLWLLTKNKILTRDNVAKRREVSHKTCLFCNEPESVNHLFFECCVAKRIWPVISEVLNLRSIWNFEYMATFWLANKKHLLTNIISSAIIWSLWNFHNKLCFQGLVWAGEKAVLLESAKILRRWRPLYDQDLGIMVDSVILALENKANVGDVGFLAFGSKLRRCDSV